RHLAAHARRAARGIRVAAPAEPRPRSCLMARPASSLVRLLERPEPERCIGPFHLVEMLGKGGFAPVWLAREGYGATELLDRRRFGEHDRRDRARAGRTRTRRKHEPHPPGSAGAARAAISSRAAGKRSKKPSRSSTSRASSPSPQPTSAPKTTRAPSRATPL